MKDQKRTIEVDGLRLQIGYLVQLENPPELYGLADAALRYTREGDAVLARVDQREDVGNQYSSFAPLEAEENPDWYAEGIAAFERLTGRPLEGEAHIVSATIWDTKDDESDWSMIVVPTSTLRAVFLEGLKYWRDWDADPPPPPPPVPKREVPAPPKAEPEDRPAAPYVPTAGDQQFFAELEPIAQSFESADASGAPITGYVRAMYLGRMEPTILDPKLLGLADALRAWGYSALARFADAATALDAYYRSDERRRIVGDGPVPLIVGGPVSLDLFRLGQVPPQDTTLHAHVARAERLMNDAPRPLEGEEGEEMVREDGRWITIAWRKEDGRTPAIVRIT